MIIAPSKQFKIGRKLNNPSDTGTYYCRAVVKNSITEITLMTVDLDDDGNHYFSKIINAPSDLSGSGLQITVFITAYDDSGYTTESLVWGTEATDYIVKDLTVVRGLANGLSGTTGTKLDYEELEKLMRKILAEMQIPAPIVNVEKTEIDLSVIEEMIKKADKSEEIAELKQMIGNLRIVNKDIGLIEKLFLKFKPAEVEDKSNEIIKIINKQNKEDLMEFADLMEEKNQAMLSDISKHISKEIVVKTDKNRKRDDVISRVTGHKVLDSESPRQQIFNKLLTR